MPIPSKRALEEITEPAHIPAIGYAYVESKAESKHEFASTSIAVGKKNTQFKDAVDDNTQFPASSLSKIVFTYLVLQWANKNQINLDEPLHDIVKKKQIELDKPLDDVLNYQRFINNGQYPEKAKQLTIRHILTHTTGLPNVGSDPSSTLLFDPNAKLGETYSYSGESFLYLQKVLEAITGQNLEDLAKMYVFDRLTMKKSTFLPQAKDAPHVVKVHTELDQPKDIYIGEPRVHAAGSLLTTANDFSKFMIAWLDDPTIQPAFEFETSFALSSLTPEEFRSLSMGENIKKYLKNATESNYGRAQFTQTEFNELKRAIDESTQAEIKNLSAKLVFESTRAYSITRTCGLGWHIYKSADEVIAYQYGENPNTRAFVAINVTMRKAAAFFTNSENGMSIANQLLSSPDLAPIGNMQELFRNMPHYHQSDEPGLKETLAGKIAEDKGFYAKAHGNFAEAQEWFVEAKRCFAKAIELSHDHVSQRLRLEWFNAAHPLTEEKQTFTQSLEQFAGKLTNVYNEERTLFIRDGSLIHEQCGKEIKLVRVSETDFLPEMDQSIKISFEGDQVRVHFTDGRPKDFNIQRVTKTQEQTSAASVDLVGSAVKAQASSYVAMASLLGPSQPSPEAQIEQTNPLASGIEQLGSEKPVEIIKETPPDSEEDENRSYIQPPI